MMLVKTGVSVCSGSAVTVALKSVRSLCQDRPSAKCWTGRSWFS